MVSDPSLTNVQALVERFPALYQAGLQCLQETSLRRLLLRLLSLVQEQVGVSCVALEVHDEDGSVYWAIADGEVRKVRKALRLPRSADGMRLVASPLPDDLALALEVPIVLEDKQIGKVYLAGKQNSETFSWEDERVVEILVGYAGIALRNVQRYERARKREQDLERRNRDLALLNQIGVTLASSLELDEILQKTLSLLMEYFRMEAGEIFLYEEGDQSLRMVLHRGEAAQAFWTRTRFRLGEGIIGLTAQTLQSIVSDDLRREVHFVREAVVQAGFRQVACVPLMARDRLKGVLSLSSRTRRTLDKDDIRLLESVAGWAGMVIENAQLHYNARRLAVLEERERIGMDLHDGVMQAIYGVGLMLEETRRLAAEPQEVEARLKKAIESLNQVMRDMRNYILDLRPHQLRDEDWLAGLRRLIAEFQQNTRLEVAVHIPKSEAFSGLPHSHALALFHVCQEALANVAKHAQARKVTISVWAATDRVLLEVHDDGKGFDMREVRHTIGHGLANMSTRLQHVGGDLEVSSAPGEGTTILAWVPRHPSG